MDTEHVLEDLIGPNDAMLSDVVRRIVQTVQPGRIILFGSAARGQMRHDSDLDLLVVKSGGYNRGLLLEDIYAALRGIACAADIVVATPDDLVRYQHAHALIYKPALSEGRVVYDAATVGAR